MQIVFEFGPFLNYFHIVSKMNVLINSLSNTDSQTMTESEEVLQLDNFIKEHAT